MALATSLVATVTINNGLGLLSSRFNCIFRDVTQTLGILTNLWFYLTPIVYPISAIPEQWRTWLLWLNPFAVIAEVYRDLVLVGEVKHWGEWGVASVVSIVTFYVGLKYYQKLRLAFADVL